MSKEYSDLLKDPRWQKLKALAMIRDNFTCQECGATDKTLHVHHKKYTGNPWDAPIDDLVTLCEDCHKGVHVPKEAKYYKKSVYDYVYETLCDIYDDKYEIWRDCVINIEKDNLDSVLLWTPLKHELKGQNEWFRRVSKYIESRLETIGIKWIYEYRKRDKDFYPEVRMYIHNKGDEPNLTYDDYALSQTDAIYISRSCFVDVDSDMDGLWCSADDIIYGTYSDDKQDGCKEGRAVPA